MIFASDFISLIIKAFEYGLLTKAIVVGIAIAISSSFLGSFLVLKRYSMMGDGLAHVSFAALAIALLFNASPLYVSIPIVSFAAIIILLMNEKAQIHGDAAIGLISSFSIALGTIIVTLSTGFNVDLFSYLFGNILLVTKTDMWISIITTVIVIGSVLLFYNELFALTYDEEYAKVLQIKTRRLNYLLAILTAIVIVVGIRAVGTMLISSLIIFPTVTAMQFSLGFKKTILFATIISVLLIVIGILLSFLLNLPTGSTIVMLNGILLFIVFVGKKIIY
ncbi:MAG: metal ABC transporter permease, partial [Erysipelotrichales bacterium]|nr:metal ABC transporter permease [Erysipelotrichales bacterium]